MTETTQIPRLNNISWKVPESEYRQSMALSYSKIAKYSREGYRTLFDETKIDTDSLRFGSLVDCLLTEPETFESRFIVVEMTVPTEAIVNIVTQIYNSLETKIPNMYEIPRNYIFKYIVENNYYANWREDTRINKIIEEGVTYFKSLFDKGDKTAVTKEEYLDATACVEELKNNEYTAELVNDKGDINIEHLYQQKFILEEPYFVRCMFDKLIVNHNEKTIQPIDYKTTHANEEDFKSSFMTWGYHIQANLYSYILEEICKKDEYFSQFTILPFKFIVINRFSRSPIVWEFQPSNELLLLGDAIQISDYGKAIKSWFELYNEIQYYYATRDIRYSKETRESNGLRELDVINVQKITDNATNIKLL